MVFGAEPSAARAFPAANIAAILPPDIGLLLHGPDMILDFTGREFDEIELTRMMELASELSQLKLSPTESKKRALRRNPCRLRLTCSRKSFCAPLRPHVERRGRLLPTIPSRSAIHIGPQRPAQTNMIYAISSAGSSKRWSPPRVCPDRRAITPASSIPKTMELYGTADMACILYTIGRLHPTEKERSEWADAFNEFQNPDTGYLVEKSPTLSAITTSTAFALGAMNLLDLTPQYPLKFAEDFKDPASTLAKPSIGRPLSILRATKAPAWARSSP